MARFQLEEFSSNNRTKGIFGSYAKNGTGSLSDDPAVIQDTDAWKEGWAAATNNGNILINYEELSGVDGVLSAFERQNWIDGITYWQPDMPVKQYQTIVQYQTDNNAPCIYYNKTGVNTNISPDNDSTNWELKLDLTKEYIDATTNQSIISGTKTFGTNSRLTLQDNAALNVNLVSTSFDWAATSSTQTTLSEMQTKDANGVICSSLYTYAGANNERVAALQAFKPDGTQGAYVEAYYNTALGVGYGIAPTPPAGVSGNEIVTAAWVKGTSIIPKLNWNAITAIPIPWTVNNYGIVIINFVSTNELIDFQCNGTAFARNAGTTYGTRGTGNIIVKPGDYIRCVGGNPSIEQASFIPFA